MVEILQKVASIDEYEVLYQAWHWQGIRAESVIFVSDDVKDLSDTQLHLRQFQLQDHGLS